MAVCIHGHVLAGANAALEGDKTVVPWLRVVGWGAAGDIHYPGIGHARRESATCSSTLARTDAVRVSGCL